MARDIAFSIGNLAGLVHMLDYVSSNTADKQSKLVLKYCLQKNPVHVDSFTLDLLEQRLRILSS